MNKEHYRKAIELAALRLIKTWDVLSKYNNVRDALEHAIYLGGGDSYPVPIGEFWMFWYSKGLKITLLGDKCREVDVPVSEFLTIANKIWHREKYQSEQLSLFE